MGEPQLQIGEPTWRALASCAAQLTEDDFRRLAGSALDELLGGAPSSAADHAGATADAMGGPSMEADGRAAVTVVACDAARLDLSGAALREALLSQLRGNVCEGSQAEGSHNRGEGDGARASDHSSARAGAAHIKGTHPGKGGANEGGTAGPHVRTSHATALTEEYATALAEEYVSRKAAIREGQLAGYSLHAPWPRLAGVSWSILSLTSPRSPEWDGLDGQMPRCHTSLRLLGMCTDCCFNFFPDASGQTGLAGKELREHRRNLPGRRARDVPRPPTASVCHEATDWAGAHFPHTAADQGRACQRLGRGPHH
eukprot:jgi/Mesvir1/15560/Mv03192-RA.2